MISEARVEAFRKELGSRCCRWQLGEREFDYTVQRDQPLDLLVSSTTKHLAQSSKQVSPVSRAAPISM